MLIIYWEGGDPKKADDLTDSGLLSGLNFYWRTIEKLYEDTYDLGDIASNENGNIWRFLHNSPTYMPTGRQLLPTYSFLEKNGVVNPITSADNVNETLEQLNSKSNRYELMGDPYWTSNEKVQTWVFYSTSKPTITNIAVKDKSGLMTLSPLYEDGVPSKDPTLNNVGDGTVPESSAKLPCNEGWADCNSISGEHAELIKKAANSIVSYLYPSQQSLISSSRVSAMAVTSTSTTTSLYLTFHGRIQPYIIDPQDRSLGVNYTSGVIEEVISDSEVNIDATSGSLSIANPVDGTYTVYLKGIYNENYTINLGYMDSTESKEIRYRGFNHANTTSFTFTVNSGSLEKITINLTPFPPTGLQADALDSSGLKTQLSWTANTEPDVTGYIIYSKYNDEPYLSQIGTSTTNSFDTGHPWTENATIKTRLYAVSAVKADGTESFLSNMVENNDRDHDGLTDEEETTFGTNPSNPDSDSDGLKDGDEYVRGTNPLLPDTDSDGFSDYAEVQAGTDPLDPASKPMNVTIELEKGFNLISYSGKGNPVVKAFDLIKMLGSSQEIESVLKFDSTSGRYKDVRYNASGEPEGEDYELVNGEGYIVYSKAAKTVDLVFSDQCSVTGLKRGVNLIGTPCVSVNMTAYQLLQKIGDDTVVYSVQRFNAETGKFETAGYLTGQPSGVDFLIKAGEGYFIYMKKDVTGFTP
jgi:hypothetical protein